MSQQQNPQNCQLLRQQQQQQQQQQQLFPSGAHSAPRTFSAHINANQFSNNLDMINSLKAKKMRRRRTNRSRSISSSTLRKAGNFL
uniref:Uncharacterized protein n=1 Tax=Globodera pallida TaxID=36090 RepID=A0A183CE32_GLOPA